MDKMRVNTQFVALFCVMLSIPAYKDVQGNIDKDEMKKMLSSYGCAIITRIPKAISSVPKLFESFKNNIFAPIELDKVITYIGISTAFRIEIDVLKKELGTFIDVFQGYNNVETICLLTGLSFPVTRMAGIKKLVDEQKERVQKNLTEVRQPKLESEINFLVDMVPKKSAGSVNDIFAKYKKK
jgi:hypothetical protein